MLSLDEALRKALRPSPEDNHRPPSSRIVVLGIGSDLRSDDAVGVRVAERVGQLLLPGVHAVVAGTAPENATGEIRRISPSHVFLVDAAEMGEAPGTVRLLDPEEVRGASFSTHTLPLRVLATYLTSEIRCAAAIIGIEPRSLAFGGELSPEAEAAVEEIVRAFQDVIGS